MNIRDKLEKESFKRYAKMSVADKLLITIQLSQLAIELNQSIDELLKATPTSKINKKRLLNLAKRARVDKKLKKYLT